jgi:hypothetical protein
MHPIGWRNDVGLPSSEEGVPWMEVGGQSQGNSLPAANLQAVLTVLGSFVGSARRLSHENRAAKGGCQSRPGAPKAALQAAGIAGRASTGGHSDYPPSAYFKYLNQGRFIYLNWSRFNIRIKYGA